MTAASEASHKPLGSEADEESAALLFLDFWNRAWGMFYFNKKAAVNKSPSLSTRAQR